MEQGAVVKFEPVWLEEHDEPTALESETGVVTSPDPFSGEVNGGPGYSCLKSEPISDEDDLQLQDLPSLKQELTIVEHKIDSQEDSEDEYKPPPVASRSKRITSLWKCDVCSKICKSRSNLAVHIRIHTGERPYVCSICEKAFKQNSALTCHTKTHFGERPFQCLVCAKNFARSSNLVEHFRTHTGEQPYKCNMCTKMFKSKSTLSYHLRTHTGERPYQCNICHKMFMSNSAVSYHIRTHSGEHPYKCNVCNKMFKSSSNVSAHIKTHSHAVQV